MKMPKANEFFLLDARDQKKHDFFPAVEAVAKAYGKRIPQPKKPKNKRGR